MTSPMFRSRVIGVHNGLDKYGSDLFVSKHSEALLRFTHPFTLYPQASIAWTHFGAQADCKSKTSG